MPDDDDPGVFVKCVVAILLLAGLAYVAIPLVLLAVCSLNRGEPAVLRRPAPSRLLHALYGPLGDGFARR